MQPLSKVRKIKQGITWGEPDTITSRPKVAVKIAECIAECADIETNMGLCLALLVETNEKQAMAMYNAVENRSSRERMLLAACEQKLTQDHSDVLTAVLRASVSPTMKQRDKLAHWCWGATPDLPDDLLLTAPGDKTVQHYTALHRPRTSIPVDEADLSKIFVVTEAYLKGLAIQLRKAKLNVSTFAASIWTKHSQQERDEYLQKLTSEPQIHEALVRIRDGRKNSEARQQARPSRQTAKP